MNNEKQLELKFWEDAYTLGVFCAKTNLMTFAARTRFNLDKDLDSFMCFLRGASQNAEFSFKDIGYEIGILRERGGMKAFDKLIKKSAGFQVFVEIIQAISVSHDWESDDQKKYGAEIAGLKSKSECWCKKKQ